MLACIDRMFKEQLSIKHLLFCLPLQWFLVCVPELVYDDVFAAWETIWAAKCVSSSHFVLFIALALVEIYRDIILENNMDFTDIIKFFNGKKKNSGPILYLSLQPMITSLISCKANQNIFVWC